VLWYLRLVTVDKIDPKDAVRDAEEIGPKDAAYWTAAETFLASLKPAQPVPAAAPAAAPAPAAAAPAETPQPTAALDAAPSSPAEPEPATQVEPRAAVPVPVADSGAWKPYLAMFVAVLGVPVAYFGRCALSLPGRMLANLPAPGRRPKSLPASSGA
jgi:2-oxoglutarate dehydrogenase E2 component (dihydrolipoamide succinyltransferase)